jgi:hypothetical protein
MSERLRKLLAHLSVTAEDSEDALGSSLSQVIQDLA